MKDLLLCILAFCMLPMEAAVAATTPNDPNSTSFQVSEKTEIPNKTLKPGNYTIHVVDHLSDRMILEVDRDGKALSTFLGLPSTSLRGHGAILVSTGSSVSALRGFAFPDGAVAEFVYPKAQAVVIAKANNVTIPAIDPASEGRVAASKLSQRDMQEVTLWMLTPTPVGPDYGSKPGIAALRYQVPATPMPQKVASASVPPRPSTVPTPATAMAPAPPPAPAPAPVRHTRPAIEALPHTASSLPLFGITGMFCLLGAGFLMIRRRSTPGTA